MLLPSKRIARCVSILRRVLCCVACGESRVLRYSAGEAPNPPNPPDPPNPPLCYFGQIHQIHFFKSTGSFCPNPPLVLFQIHPELFAKSTKSTLRVFSNPPRALSKSTRYVFSNPPRAFGQIHQIHFSNPPGALGWIWLVSM